MAEFEKNLEMRGFPVGQNNRKEYGTKPEEKKDKNLNDGKEVSL